MLAEALVFVLAQEEKAPDAKGFLRTTMLQVQRAKTFEATIEHHDSSGLFPGEYKQRLRWRSGVGFEIVVTERGTASPNLPNYYGRGGTVVSVYRDMRSLTESSATRPGITPGWEVVGGLNMTFLAKSSLADFLFAEPKPPVVDKNVPPPDVQVPPPPSLSYRQGERREWQGVSVREIVAQVSGAHPYEFSIFVHPTSRYVIGMEAKQPSGAVGWMIYRDIKVDGEMPSDLGTAPGG